MHSGSRPDARATLPLNSQLTNTLNCFQPRMTLMTRMAIVPCPVRCVLARGIAFVFHRASYRIGVDPCPVRCESYLIGVTLGLPPSRSDG
jgi:hypothetical protein